MSIGKTNQQKIKDIKSKQRVSKKMKQQTTKTESENPESNEYI